MSINRFIKGVLKGDIANMQAEQARQAEKLKKEQEAKDKTLQFNRTIASTLLNNLDVSQLPAGFDYTSAFESIGNSSNPIGGTLNLMSQMEQKKDFKGLNFLSSKILPVILKDINKKDLPAVLQNFSKFSTDVTDMDSLNAKMGELGGIFEGITDETTGFSDEQNAVKDLIKQKLSSLNTAVTEGKLQANKIPAFPISMELPNLRAYLNMINKIQTQDNESDDTAAKPSNYKFTIKGNTKTFLKEDSDEFPNIISNMTDMTRELKELIEKGQIDPKDATFQNEFKMEMNKQYSRALSFYESPNEDNQGQIPEGQIIDIEAFTTVFKDDPDFAFAKDLFESFEQGIPFTGFVTQGIENNGDQKNKEIIEIEPNGEFEALATTVGSPNEKSFINKFAHLGTDDKDTEPFVRANILVNQFPSLFEGGENKLRSLGSYETNREITDKLFVRLNLFTREDPSTGQKIPLNVRDKIAVLQVLTNMPTKSRKKGRDSFTLNNTQKGYLLALTGSQVNSEGKQKTIEDARAYITKKAADGDELLKLIDAQRAAIVYGNVGTGFSQDIRRLFNGITSTTGQIDQIKNLLIGGGGTGYGFNEADFKSSEDYQNALNSAAKFIMDQNPMGVEFGFQASGEVFLAYQIAKYNDEGGRLSNQDFQYNLQAVAGGKASSQAEALAHLAFVRDRFEKDQVKFSNFQFDPSRLSIHTNPDGVIGATRYANVLFSRLDATMQYYQMYSSPNMKQAQLIQNYPVQAKINAGIDKLESTNIMHTVRVGNQEKQFLLYRVLDADTDKARFKDYGGVYAVTMGGITKTVPYEDIDYSSLQDSNAQSSSALGAVLGSQEKTYTKLDMGNNTFMVQEKSGNAILQVMTPEEAEKLGIDLNTLQ